MSTESGVPSNHLILCHSLFILPSIFPGVGILTNEWLLHISCPKYWSFNYSTSPSMEYSGLISVRIDWFHLLSVQGTLKSLLQHHSSKASILWHSALFMAQLSHLYLTSGKTIALTWWTFVGKVMSLLFFFFFFVTGWFFFFFLFFSFFSYKNPPPSSLPTPSLWVVPAHQPQASSIAHRTRTGISFHTWYFTCFNAILPNLPTLSLSYKVHKTVLYISVSFAVSYTGLSLPSF